MEFKVGDKVRCKLGYTNRRNHEIEYAWQDLSYGGYGYEGGRTFIIERIWSDEKRTPVFGIWANGEYMNGGVFIDAIEHCGLVRDFNLKKFSFGQLK